MRASPQASRSGYAVNGTVKVGHAVLLAEREPFGVAVGADRDDPRGELGVFGGVEQGTEVRSCARDEDDELQHYASLGGRLGERAAASAPRRTRRGGPRPPASATSTAAGPDEERVGADLREPAGPGRSPREPGEHPSSSPPTRPMPPTAASPQRAAPAVGGVDAATSSRHPARKPAAAAAGARGSRTASPCGSAPSTGMPGTGPSSVPAGATEEPAPSAKPGPISQARGPDHEVRADRELRERQREAAGRLAAERLVEADDGGVVDHHSTATISAASADHAAAAPVPQRSETRTAPARRGQRGERRGDEVAGAASARGCGRSIGRPRRARAEGQDGGGSTRPATASTRAAAAVAASATRRPTSEKRRPPAEAASR